MRGPISGRLAPRLACLVLAVLAFVPAVAQAQGAATAVPANAHAKT